MDQLLEKQRERGLDSCHIKLVDILALYRDLIISFVIFFFLGFLVKQFFVKVILK